MSRLYRVRPQYISSTVQCPVSCVNYNTINRHAVINSKCKKVEKTKLHVNIKRKLCVLTLILNKTKKNMCTVASSLRL